jgi:phosphohistidine phosphatase
MRHAKAEPFAATDHERVLTDRGRRDAVEAGLHLASIDAVPDYAVVSSAARAVATWESVVHGSRSTAEVIIDDAVYSGSPEVVLESLVTAPLDARVLICVGHNPTVAYLAHMLDDGHGEPAAVREMLQGYPAAAMAVLEIDVPWSDLGPETGRVIDFHVGRG